MSSLKQIRAKGTQFSLTIGRAEYANLSHQEKQVQEFKGSLRFQQNVFTQVTAECDAAAKASFVLNR